MLIYIQDRSFYVHYLTLSQSEAAALHGKKIRPDRFHGKVESRPDERLVEWHYRQCIMAHMRVLSQYIIYSDLEAALCMYRKIRMATNVIFHEGPFGWRGTTSSLG